MHRPPRHAEVVQEGQVQLIGASRAGVFRSPVLFKERNLTVDGRRRDQRHDNAADQELVFSLRASGRRVPVVQRRAGPFVVRESVTAATDLRGIPRTSGCASRLYVES